MTHALPDRSTQLMGREAHLLGRLGRITERLVEIGLGLDIVIVVVELSGTCQKSLVVGRIILDHLVIDLHDSPCHGRFGGRLRADSERRRQQQKKCDEMLHLVECR